MVIYETEWTTIIWNPNTLQWVRFSLKFCRHSADSCRQNSDNRHKPIPIFSVFGQQKNLWNPFIATLSSVYPSLETGRCKTHNPKVTGSNPVSATKWNPVGVRITGFFTVYKNLKTSFHTAIPYRNSSRSHLVHLSLCWICCVPKWGHQPAFAGIETVTVHVQSGWWLGMSKYICESF